MRKRALILEEEGVEEEREREREREREKGGKKEFMRKRGNSRGGAR